jgi:hypothetical protein
VDHTNQQRQAPDDLVRDQGEDPRPARSRPELHSASVCLYASGIPVRGLSKWL